MKLFNLTMGLVLGACALNASARDDIVDYSVADALASEQAKNILGTEIQFYFGDQPHGTVTKTILETRTNKKTNGANKSDKEACEWAFLSAMKALKEKAQSVGANAVVNIRSNYRNNTTSSATTFKCGSGMLISGVALIGDVVVIQ
ncbi:MAG TPA: heavy metal-binding domain-containing protein [Cellvibrio sp.]|nr:heavy metal-binding domain-containing protein [Cellvibrio sp.]